MRLNFIDEIESGVDRALFDGLFRKMEDKLKDRIFEYLADSDGEINLILFDDKAMRELNREQRGIDKSTDVLSFPYLELGEGIVHEGILTVGDIFISVETAERQADEKGHDLLKELSILFVHGLLHIFGFDHNTDEEEAEMEGWAQKILQ